MRDLPEGERLYAHAIGPFGEKLDAERFAAEETERHAEVAETVALGVDS
ncbi:hypothetical protein [Streptosporangium subroseum]|nr:hypothetical protein [Streptosporangium subroseum]